MLNWYRIRGRFCFLLSMQSRPQGENGINNFLLLFGYGYGLQMSSVVRVIPVGLHTHVCPNRHSEVRVEDGEAIYEQLIAPLESRMMRSIWRVVRSPDLAEDTLQDALTVIWKKLHIVRSHPNPEALILKICLNAAFDSLRKQTRSQRHEEFSILRDTPESPERGALSALSAKEVEAEVLRAIGRLPRKQALAVLMRVVQEEPFEVVASALGCSEVTARIQVSKGRARLQKWLAHLNPSAGKEAPDESGQRQRA